MLGLKMWNTKRCSICKNLPGGQTESIEASGLSHGRDLCTVSLKDE